MLRVAGYGGLFVALDRSTPDDIIRRASHNLGCVVGVEILCPKQEYENRESQMLSSFSASERRADT